MNSNPSKNSVGKNTESNDNKKIKETHQKSCPPPFGPQNDPNLKKENQTKNEASKLPKEFKKTMKEVSNYLIAQPEVKEIITNYINSNEHFQKLLKNTQKFFEDPVGFVSASKENQESAEKIVSLLKFNHEYFGEDEDEKEK